LVFPGRWAFPAEVETVAKPDGCAEMDDPAEEDGNTEAVMPVCRGDREESLFPSVKSCGRLLISGNCDHNN